MGSATVLEVPGPHGVRRVRLSSAERVLWPATDTAPAVTKGDLAGYVQQVGEALLRGLADRPVTLQRFPDGIDGEAFYSKNPPRGVPEWVRTTTCTYPSGRRHPQLVLDEPAAAVWAVQMNTVTFHPWPVRSADNDHPDQVRIDLDPQPGRGFRDVAEAARGLRDLMTELGLVPYVKTSGNRGLHVYAAIRPEREFLEVRHGVIGIARELERRMPELVTSAWWKEERGEKVFVDYNQATRDRTIAAAWSPRPLPGATVSVPVTWEELDEEGFEPRSLTVRTVPERLAQRGDPWAGMAEDVGDLAGAMALWEADLERGLGELPFPPDHPKMPGEPRRVQPSRKRNDLPDPEDRRAARPAAHHGEER